MPMHLDPDSERRGRLSALKTIRNSGGSRKLCEPVHDEADGAMWKAHKRGDSKSYSFHYGRAMTLGNYVHTGRKGRF